MTNIAVGLAGFLAAQWGRPVQVHGLQASSAGARRRNVVFQVEYADRPLTMVATIVPDGVSSLNPVNVEADIRSLARSHRVPVPAVHGCSTDSSWLGNPFFLSEFVSGETVPRRVLRLVAEEAIGQRLAAQLGEALARLHGIEANEAPAGMLDPGSTPAAESALVTCAKAMKSAVVPRPALALGFRWLERHLPAPPPKPSIVHGDARNGNMIVGPDGLRALLDWEAARRGGDPMEDLAWSALRTWRFRHDSLEIGGFAARQPLIEAYEAAGGEFDEDRFAWWKVLGTLRWALGLYGQATAHIDGRFRSIIMAASGPRVPELEWDLLMLIRRPSSGVE